MVTGIWTCSCGWFTPCAVSTVECRNCHKAPSRRQQAHIGKLNPGRASATGGAVKPERQRQKEAVAAPKVVVTPVRVVADADGYVNVPKSRKAKRAAARAASAAAEAKPRAAAKPPPAAAESPVGSGAQARAASPDDSIAAGDEGGAMSEGGDGGLGHLSDAELASHLDTARKLGPLGADVVAAIVAERERRVAAKQDALTFPQRQRQLANVAAKAQRALEAKDRSLRAAEEAAKSAAGALAVAQKERDEAFDAAAVAEARLREGASAALVPAFDEDNLLGHLPENVRMEPEVAQALTFAGPMLRASVELARMRVQRARQTGTAAVPDCQQLTPEEEAAAAEGRATEEAIRVLIDEAASRFDTLQRQRTTAIAKLAAIQATRPAGMGAEDAGDGLALVALPGMRSGDGGPDDEYDADLGCGSLGWGDAFSSPVVQQVG